MKAPTLPGRTESAETEVISDLMTTGSILGEMALLTGNVLYKTQESAIPPQGIPYRFKIVLKQMLEVI